MGNHESVLHVAIALTQKYLRHLSLVIIWLVSQSGFAFEPAELLKDFPRGSLIIESAGPRCLHIQTAFADAPKLQSQGLMFVQEMDEFEGMLFRYSEPATINMWMKNTLIPLDMIFVDTEGQVVKLAANTTPLSTHRISSAKPVVRVLELNAGFAARWGLKNGNRVLLEQLTRTDGQN